MGVRPEFGLVIRVAGAFVACVTANATAARTQQSFPEVPPPPPPLEVAPIASPGGEVAFVPVADLRQHGGKVELKLRQATVANTADWLVSFRADFAAANGDEETCTAVLIGPQVMLTAAHCIPSSGQVRYGPPDSSKPASCSRHEAWVRGDDPSADFALCKLHEPFAGPPGFSFETVNLTRLTPNAAAQRPLPVLLTGYGCVDNETKRQKIDGKYRIGLTALVDSSFSQQPALGARYYAADGGEGNNLFTSSKGPNLCPGDSGGPAFMVTASSGSRSQYANRTVIGVNSRVFFGDKAKKVYGSSMISALGAGAFETWAKAWLGALPACGLTGSLPNCRQ